MLFSPWELVQWLGFATFQIFVHLLAVLRLFWVLTVLSLKFLSEMLLCQKLVGQTTELWFSLITSPVFILLQLLMICACRVN
ncbi:Transmembrane protein 203 [Sciurus carolinensis]|uniref:Transmembrane protein 203 n=1 Tax=Sciurus carolinensis TaxID=30640 RepID=A0AA41NFQ0_SCICA|nr:transmembrane protein 203-like [Sciurus carolinensis]MBZ3889504.1 Transmembrane protein 203 [Sciurus carolinensis]